MNQVFHVTDNGIIKTFRSREELIAAYPGNYVEYLIDEYEKKQEDKKQEDIKRSLFLKHLQYKINKFNKKHSQSQITKDLLDIYLDID